MPSWAAAAKAISSLGWRRTGFTGRRPKPIRRARGSTTSARADSRFIDSAKAASRWRCRCDASRTDGRSGMNKAFTRKPDPRKDAHGPAAEDAARARVATLKNYITPGGLQRLKDEHRFLLLRERPAMTKVVAWAASNGDRSENADYQYGKRRLRE